MSLRRCVRCDDVMVVHEKGPHYSWEPPTCYCQHCYPLRERKAKLYRLGEAFRNAFSTSNGGENKIST